MGNIVSELILKTGLFSSGVKNAQNSLKELHSSVIGTKELIVGAFAAIGSSVAIIKLKEAFNVGAELNNLSNATGAAVSDLMVLKQAFEENGMAADTVGPSIGKLRKAIVSAAATGDGEAFRKLGVNVKALGNMSAAEQMKTIGDAIMRIQNPTERSAYAMQLFGKNGQAMLSMFANSGAMDEAAAAIGDQAKILNDNSAIFKDITNKLNLVGVKIQGFFVGMAAQIAPAIKPLMDAFAQMDFSKWGEALGNAISLIVTAFSSGDILTIVGQALILAFKEAINFLSAALMGCVTAFGQYMIEYIKNCIMVLEIITTADFWKGLGTALLGIFEGVIAWLDDAIANILDRMKNIPGVGGAAASAAQTYRETAAQVRSWGQQDRAEGSDLLAPAMAKYTKRMTEAVVNIGGAFMAGFNQGPKIFDTDDNKRALSAAVEHVSKAVEANKAAADKYEQEHKPGQQAPTEDMTEDPKRKLGAAFAQTLFKIGGGGVSVGGGGAVDPVLQENRRHTSLLQTIARNTALKTGGLKTGNAGFA